MTDNDFVDLAENTEEKPPVARGALVFYFNVGQMPTYNAEAFITKMKEQYIANMSPKLPDDIAVFFIPVRNPQETLVDFIPFSVTEQELLDDVNGDNECLMQEGEDGLLPIRRGCCRSDVSCCQEEEEEKPGFFGRLKNSCRNLCRSIFGDKCCS